MKGLDVVGHGEVHAVAREEPVVVFAVDQVLDFLVFFVDRQVEEVADAVGFFADVVAINKSWSAVSYDMRKHTATKASSTGRAFFNAAYAYSLFSS